MITKEIMPTKRIFNARERELLANGFRKTTDYKNIVTYRKHVFMGDLSIHLVRGWKQNAN